MREVQPPNIFVACYEAPPNPLLFDCIPIGPNMKLSAVPPSGDFTEVPPGPSLFEVIPIGPNMHMSIVPPVGDFASSKEVQPPTSCKEQQPPTPH